MGGGGPSGGGGGGASRPTQVDARESAIRAAAQRTTPSAPRVAKPSRPVREPSGAEKQDFRLAEQKRGQQVGPAAGKTQEAFRRNIEAAQEIEARDTTRLPGVTGAILAGIGQASRTAQAKILREQSTTAEPIRDESGRVVGVVGEGLFGGRAYTGRREFDPIASKTVESRDGTVQPEVTPEVTPEVVPDETVLGQAVEMQDKRRRTRTKRVGGGGTMLEGFGALYK